MIPAQVVGLKIANESKESDEIGIGKTLEYGLELISKCTISSDLSQLQISTLTTIMILLLSHVGNDCIIYSLTKIMSSLPQVDQSWWPKTADKFEPILEFPAFITAIELLSTTNSSGLSNSIIQHQLAVEELDLKSLQSMLTKSPYFATTTSSYNTTLLHTKLFRITLKSLNLVQDRVIQFINI